MTIERFMNKVLIDSETGCWLWQEAKDRNGYGKLHVVLDDGRRTVVVPHRWLYKELIRPVPTGLELDHAECQTKACCNPMHLEEVTHQENMDRVYAQKRFCVHGHSLDDAYVYAWHGRRQRHCRTCSHLRYRANKQGTQIAMAV